MEFCNKEFLFPETSILDFSGEEEAVFPITIKAGKTDLMIPV
jgi:hypothetical protein